MKQATEPWNTPAVRGAGGGGRASETALWQTRRNPAAQSHGTVASPLTAGQRALCSPDCNRQTIRKRWDAKVGPSPCRSRYCRMARDIHGMVARPPDTLHPRILQRKEVENEEVL